MDCIIDTFRAAFSDAKEAVGYDVRWERAIYTCVYSENMFEVRSEAV